MKKLTVLISMMLFLCSYNVIAQEYEYYEENEEIYSFTDGFFSQDKMSKRATSDDWGTMPLLPKTHGYHYDYPAQETPVGSGLLLLAGMGLGYAIRKRKMKN